LFDLLRSRRLHHTHRNPAGGFILLCKHTGKINVSFDGYDLSMQDHIFEDIADLLCMEPKRRNRDFSVE